MARQRRPTQAGIRADMRDDQLQRASRLRTSATLGAAALTVAIGWVAASTIPGRASSTAPASAAQNVSSQTSEQVLQAPDQAPSADNSGFGGGGGGGFVVNSGGS